MYSATVVDWLGTIVREGRQIDGTIDWKALAVAGSRVYGGASKSSALERGRGTSWTYFSRKRLPTSPRHPLPGSTPSRASLPTHKEESQARRRNFLVKVAKPRFKLPGQRGWEGRTEGTGRDICQRISAT